MAKISKKTERLRDGEIDQHIEFTVFYNSDIGFYAEVPGDYGENFDQLDDEQLKKLAGQKKYGRKYASADEPHKRIVVATTEDELVEAMKTMVLHLIKMTLAKVPVILIEFEDKSEHADSMYQVVKRQRRGMGDDYRDPNELPTVGLEFSATYCFQVSASGGKDRFYKYDEHKRRTEVHLGWREKKTMIPDTPENRLFIEELHKALYTLVTKMREFTATPEDMLKLIDSRQKLLSL
jgi:hypothetical protein